MSNARWIWYYGDYEIYHHLLVHTRREDMGCDFPCTWPLDVPYPVVKFRTTFTAKTDTVLHVHAHGRGMFYIGWNKYPVNKDINISAGDHTIEVQVMRTDGAFPCIYIDNEYLITDKNWFCSALNAKWVNAGDSPAYLNACDEPEVFPFSYKKLDFVSKKAVSGGVLYDFGKETFARITVDAKSDDKIRLCYGESEKEALDFNNAIVSDELSGKTHYVCPARAMRWLFVEGDAKIIAEYEYLPIQDKGRFECDNDDIKRIFDICAYTFHLNSREFYLDGIKRDRWVWSGDAYQSFMINHYLYGDNDIIKRTIVALLGKPPYEIHINTINDYSMFLIISLADYYKATGDIEFVKSVYIRIKELYKFITSRLDNEGLVYEREEDWVFIDWSELDKSGPHCAEQILLWQCSKCMAELAELCCEDNEVYITFADEMKEKIFRLYWKDDKGAFIDCHTSGKNLVTRHANIFAVLYDLVDDEKKHSIKTNVLDNDCITQITTPYFKLYELMARAKLGDIDTVQRYIAEYWGGMIKLGATSIWEQFDPEMSGDEHYEMYGAAYGKSLCHAWGAGPIYLLLRYVAGVYPTDIGYKTFCVEPKAGLYKRFKATVPLGFGTVKIEYSNSKITVIADRDGGTLKYGGKEYILKKNESMTV